jgi:putative mRNA 3-end processing factor
VTWRDGVHLTGTPIWCDARRRRDVCFASSADRIGRAGHGQLIATPLTLALLGASAGGHLGVPLHRRFTLGTVRLELIASGRGPGAAALWADIAGKTVLYAGAIRGDAEVRKCDALVVGAPVAARKQAVVKKAIDKTLDWAKKELAAGRRPVILVETALDGLEVAAQFSEPLAASRAIREALQRVHELGASAPAALRGVQVGSPGKQPRPTVWLARESVAKLGAHSVQPAWSNVASRDELLAWIEATRAKEIYVTGDAAEDIAKAVGAKVIGPPMQMTLWEARA